MQTTHQNNHRLHNEFLGHFLLRKKLTAFFFCFVDVSFAGATEQEVTLLPAFGTSIWVCIKLLEPSGLQKHKQLLPMRNTCRQTVRCSMAQPTEAIGTSQKNRNAIHGGERDGGTK